jgi:hypothetical protein
VERYAQAVAGLREEAKHAQRDPDSIALAYWASWYKEGETLKLDDGQRRVFTGSDADVARDIAAFRALGASSLLFNFARPTLAESLSAMERFVAQVVPLVPKS